MPTCNYNSRRRLCDKYDFVLCFVECAMSATAVVFDTGMFCALLSLLQLGTLTLSDDFTNTHLFYCPFLGLTLVNQWCSEGVYESLCRLPEWYFLQMGCCSDNYVKALLVISIVQHFVLLDQKTLLYYFFHADMAHFGQNVLVGHYLKIFVFFYEFHIL